MIQERKMVSRVIAGDLDAFARLIRQYEALVFHIAGRMADSTEDRKDICQEVFINVYKGLPGFAFQSKLSSWIGRIALHTAISYLRKHRKSHVGVWPEDEAFDYAGDDTPHDRMARKEISAHLHRLIRQLPEHYKTVLTLYHLNEFSYLEIEAATGMPGGTIKSYLFRARKLLREKLERQSYDAALCCFR